MLRATGAKARCTSSGLGFLGGTDQPELPSTFFTLSPPVGPWASTPNCADDGSAYPVWSLVAPCCKGHGEALIRTAGLCGLAGGTNVGSHCFLPLVLPAIAASGSPAPTEPWYTMP